MTEWWHNTSIGMSSPEQAALVNMAIWASLAITVIWQVLSLWQRRRHEQAQIRRARSSAKAQARLAVFNSWVKAGGWTTGLNESIYDSNLRQYDEMALKHGHDYYSDYCEERELAEVELDNTIDMTLRAFREAQ